MLVRAQPFQPKLRVASLTAQSTGLLIRQIQVRVPGDVPATIALVVSVAKRLTRWNVAPVTKGSNPFRHPNNQICCRHAMAFIRGIRRYQTSGPRSSIGRALACQVRGSQFETGRGRHYPWAWLNGLKHLAANQDFGSSILPAHSNAS
jgi:hypothetical protein